MRCSAKTALLAALLLAGCDKARTQPNPPPPVAAASGHTLRIEGKAIAVQIDMSLIDQKQGNRVTVIKRVGNLALLLDSWASQPQSMSRCQAGHESWLRLIDIGAGREVFAKQVESCLNNVEPDDPVATWADGASQIDVEMVSEPGFTLALDGKVTMK